MSDVEVPPPKKKVVKKKVPVVVNVDAIGVEKEKAKKIKSKPPSKTTQKKTMLTESFGVSTDIKSSSKLIQVLKNQMNPSFGLDVAPKTWIMNNRVKFDSWADSSFRYGKVTAKQSCGTCDKGDGNGSEDGECVKVDSITLFPHQKIIKDYMQYASPYRGILMYFGLGAGKSCSSIAAAEILMDHMDVVVMVPASLKNNYLNEIKKCGRRFYNLKQHWTFVPWNVFEEDVETVCSLVGLDKDILKSNGGLWVPVNEKATNFGGLAASAQNSITEQVDNMINKKISFINYNGLKTSNITEMIKNGGNPFDGKCVIVDEVHNLISRIVNGGKIGTSLYKLLMSAKNCKLILLSGTPIINYPYEISYLINLIVGLKTLHTLTINKTSIFDKDFITNVLKNNVHVDFFHIDEIARKIHFTLLPEGFVFTSKGKMKLGVEREEKMSSASDVRDVIIDSLKKGKISVSKKEYHEDFKVLPEDEGDFNKYFIDMDKGTMINTQLFSRRVLGTVSHYSFYPEELYPKWDIEDSVETMTDSQFHVYEKSRLEERKKESKSKHNKGTGGNVFKETGQVYRFYSRANCNFVFPEEIKRPFPSMSKVAEEIDDEEYVLKAIEKGAKDDGESGNNATTGNAKKDKSKEYEKALSLALKALVESPKEHLKLSNLGNYSPKFKKIIERVNELNGTALVYSQFRRVEGLGILGHAMKANGYAEFKIVKTPGGWDLDIAEEDMDKPKYIVFTGNNEETQVLLRIFNSDVDSIPPLIKSKLAANATNIRGENIKVLMITQSGAEGISLKNVRQVHVVEPYWNHIRIDQVIGRAVRTCSHLDLPPKDRNVKVFVYTMKFAAKQIASSFTLRTQDNSMTSDEYIYNLAKKKAAIINSLLETLKKAAIDCALNAKVHNNRRCFSFPLNMKEDSFTYPLKMGDELFDYQTQKDIENIEWHGKVLVTKKGNFLVKPSTSEVFDYDIYVDSGKLVKMGILKEENGGKKQIVKD